MIQKLRAGLGFALSVTVLAGAGLRLTGCGGAVAASPDDAGDSTEDASTFRFDASRLDSGFLGFDATPFPREDAGPAPDGGPPPIVDCSDASTDGGVDCPLPPTVCLNDYWLRSYYGGMCGDAGVCEYSEITMECPPNPPGPPCFQGGCRILILR